MRTVKSYAFIRDIAAISALFAIILYVKTAREIGVKAILGHGVHA